MSDIFKSCLYEFLAFFNGSSCSAGARIDHFSSSKKVRISLRKVYIIYIRWVTQNKINGGLILSYKKGFSLTELNKPEEWTKLEKMDKKHVPIIEAPEEVEAKEPFNVKIKVGGIDGVEHPNTLGHWINWVELYAGERLISKIEFEPEMCDGYVVNLNVTLDETATLRAREFCNLHGLWEGKEKKVRVK